jgi:hypothetical protein
MPSSSSLDVVSIIDYKRPFNVDLGSITEYFSSVLASDGNLDRGALKNGNLLFKDHFIHNITVARQYIKRIILAKCRAQMKKSTIYEVSTIKYIFHTNLFFVVDTTNNKYQSTIGYIRRNMPMCRRKRSSCSM